eukprot:3741890-Pyramimonas_sp.AAC.1
MRLTSAQGATQQRRLRSAGWRGVPGTAIQESCRENGYKQRDKTGLWVIMRPGWEIRKVSHFREAGGEAVLHTVRRGDQEWRLLNFHRRVTAEALSTASLEEWIERRVVEAPATTPTLVGGDWNDDPDG